MALCAGVARADLYGFVDGDRVSVIISDKQPQDPRYKLFKKGEAGRYTLPAAPAAAPAAWVPAAAAPLRLAKYGSEIVAAAKETNVDPALIRAVIAVESSYNPLARSPAGAVGLMQLMPRTAVRYGVTNRLDPAQNIRGGAHYLRDLKVLFNNNLQLVLAAYNAGETAVIKHGRRIPPYRETVAYVPKVLGHYKRFSAAPR